MDWCEKCGTDNPEKCTHVAGGWFSDEALAARDAAKKAEGRLKGLEEAAEIVESVGRRWEAGSAPRASCFAASNDIQLAIRAAAETAKEGEDA